MREPFSWTIRLGQWWGVPVGIHLFFVLGGVLLLALNWPATDGTPLVAATALVYVGVWIISALLHELAHVYVALNLGGQVDEIILAPWGGDSRIYPPYGQRAQLVMHAAGPLFNGIALATAMLCLVGAGHPVQSVFDLLTPPALVEGSVIIDAVKIIGWVNWLMLAVSLLPLHPLDGSKMLRSLLWESRPQAPRVQIETIVLAVGIGVALALFAAAWLMVDTNRGPLQPTWALLAAAGAVATFTARWGFHLAMQPVESDAWEADRAATEGDEADDLDDIGCPAEESVSQWLEQRRQMRQTMREQLEMEEDATADEILAKLHSNGPASLTEAERALLERVSFRYRRRRQLPS